MPRNCGRCSQKSLFLCLLCALRFLPEEERGPTSQLPPADREGLLPSLLRRFGAKAAGRASPGSLAPKGPSQSLPGTLIQGCGAAAGFTAEPQEGSPMERQSAQRDPDPEAGGFSSSHRGRGASPSPPLGAQSIAGSRWLIRRGRLHQLPREAAGTRHGKTPSPQEGQGAGFQPTYQIHFLLLVAGKDHLHRTLFRLFQDLNCNVLWGRAKRQGSGQGGTLDSEWGDLSLGPAWGPSFFGLAYLTGLFGEDTGRKRYVLLSN